MPTKQRKHGTLESTCNSPEERINCIRRIVANSQYEKIDGCMIDLFSASAIVAVYDALNEENRLKFASCPAPKMAIIALKFMK